MSGLLVLPKIHFMILLWLICFFGLLAVAAVTVYLILHYVYFGEQWVVFRLLPGGRRQLAHTPPALSFAACAYPEPLPADRRCN